MNPDDDDAAINQLKHPRISINILPKTTTDLIKSLQNRILGKCLKVNVDLRTYAEDELVRKEYKEMRCEMPGTPRSTFLMVFSPDGSLVASTHGNHNIYVTDIKSGKHIKTLVGHPRTPWCIAFHPTCNQLLASGCLGGQVRVWDLSGGSEVWTATNQTVIASIAFHPSDRFLVIATFNELHFWDWSEASPITHIATSNIKEKVRFVTFDRLGQKLITGIANTPISRWDRNFYVTRTSERPRVMVSSDVVDSNRNRMFLTRRNLHRPFSTEEQPEYSSTTSTTAPERVPLSSVPERERRITACYRNLVHEYELLVHRYLQVYRPPNTTDRGTDPMETDQSSASPQTTSSLRLGNQLRENTAFTQLGPSTSSSTQPPPSPNTSTDHTTNYRMYMRPPQSESVCVRLNCIDRIRRRRLVMRTTSGVQTNTESSSSQSNVAKPCDSKLRIKCSPKKSTSTTASVNSTQIRSEPGPSKISEEPSNQPSTSTDPKYNLACKSNKEPWHVKIKRTHSGLVKKCSKHIRRRIFDTPSDTSSSEDNESSASKRPYTSSNASTTTTVTTSTATNSATFTDVRSPVWADNSRTQNDRVICLENLVSNNACHEALRRSSNGNGICDRCGGNVNANTETSVGTSTDSNVNTNLRSDENTRNCLRPTSFLANVSAWSSAAESLQEYRQRYLSSREQPCARTLVNTETRTTNSTIYTPSSNRFHIERFLQEFRIQRRPPPVSELINSRQSNNFALDEVINYSERLNAEDDLVTQPQQPNLSEIHPFDPPPEFPSINPENIGIGNMYSNIVQDLESSLSNARNIGASNRPGETSDMLSSFSERLESIMLQSDNILRNLSQTTDMLINHSEQNTDNRRQPRMFVNDPNFFIRDLNNSNNVDRDRTRLRNDMVESLIGYPGNSDELSSNRWAMSDHTYPRNPENPRHIPNSADNLQPLMTSLHFTISHIQRQARLLRVQVECIERIDRAMVEVAQLQTIRQVFSELRRHLSNIGSDNRSTGVSSVRQMMAGTRISDSSPYDSPVEEEVSRRTSNNTSSTNNPTAGSSTSLNAEAEGGDVSSDNPPQGRPVERRKLRCPARLDNPSRHNRRYSILSYIPRRLSARERLIRRRLYYRTLSLRSRLSLSNNPTTDFNSDSNFGVCTKSLALLTRRLENLLTEHIRHVDRGVNQSSSSSEGPSASNESAITGRLMTCRQRILRIVGPNRGINNIVLSDVTQDGASRYTARLVLTFILCTFTRFFEDNLYRNNLTLPHRNHIRHVIDLNLLLTDILLLQIVESIPPPTGMNLDPERESLSTRIDQMCSRMLQNRHSQSGHTHNLTRSLRLMRLTARYASRALGQTYNARRNAMFTNSNNSRRELLGQINSTLQNIRRNGGITYGTMETSHPSLNTLNEENPRTTDLQVQEWYRTINALITRYDSMADILSSTSGNTSRTSTTNEDSTILPPSSSSTAQVSSDDTDDYNEPIESSSNNVGLGSPRIRQLILRPHNVNLFPTAPFSNSSVPSHSQSLNVPTFQINDIPVTEVNSTWHSRLNQSRYRISELRGNVVGGVFRPRFLHPLYSGVNPFDADLDDPQRDQVDNDMVLTVTPNHRIQVWDISNGNIPDISNAGKNVVVPECKIHNDASVDISSDGSILVTLLPSGGYLNVTNRLGVYSLKWETLGQCLYMTSFEQNAVSVSLSPLSRHLVVGLASRRVSIVPNDRWTMARVFLIKRSDREFGGRLPVLRELEQNRDTNHMSLNCIRWLPVSGQGLIYGTNTGQLRILS